MCSILRNVSSFKRCNKFPYTWLRTITINANYLNQKKFLKSECSCAVSQNRTLISFKTPSEQELKEIDGIPEPYSLIYRHPFDIRLLVFQAASTVSAAVVLIAALLSDDFFLQEMSRITASQKTIMTSIAVVSFSYTVVQFILNQTPMRIYYLAPRKHYIFVFYGYYPTSIVHRKCIIGDVLKMPRSKLPPWKDSNYIIQNQQYLFLFDKYFRKPDDLPIMLGKQKDPDVDDDQEEINK